MNDLTLRRRQLHSPTIIHHIICQHQMEIELWPAAAEVYFRDERFTDPANSQVRFDAIVYNAPSSAVIWEVKSIDGGAGQGSIDPTGLYSAPPKGSLPSGLTDIIIASVADDPLRKAYARVTLIGLGPAPLPEPRLEIFPKQVYLYYPSNISGSVQNEYIDASNKRQLFRAIINRTDSTEVEWFVDQGSGYGPRVGALEPWYLYVVSGSGSTGQVVKIKAQLKDSPTVVDEARVIQINYAWPGIL